MKISFIVKSWWKSLNNEVRGVIIPIICMTLIFIISIISYNNSEITPFCYEVLQNQIKKASIVIDSKYLQDGKITVSEQRKIRRDIGRYQIQQTMGGSKYD